MVVGLTMRDFVKPGDIPAGKPEIDRLFPLFASFAAHARQKVFILFS